MNLFTLSLLLVSPLLGYAVFLLLQESDDPLNGFHESFRKRHLAFIAPESESTEDSAKTYVSSLGSFQNLLKYTKYRIAFAFLGFFLFLIFSKYPLVGLFLLGLAAIAYRKWSSRLENRIGESTKKAIELEFPAFAEIYTILVVAGESPSLALIRISESIYGKFGILVNQASEEIRNGSGLHSALEHMSSKSGSKVVRRFVDALIIASERGTPLADVLHRQVEDARKHHQSEILKAAGKAEIALMIPVVFLILPISVLFALWPSYLALGQNMF